MNKIEQETPFSEETIKFRPHIVIIIRSRVPGYGGRVTSYLFTINCLNLYYYVPILFKVLKRRLMADAGDQVSVFLRPFSSHMSIALRTLADGMLKDEASSFIIIQFIQFIVVKIILVSSYI